MPDIQIKIRVNDDGSMSLIDQAGQKLSGLGQSASVAGQGFLGLGSSLTDLKSGFDLISGALSQSAGMIDAVNKLGVESIRTKQALDALSGGQSGGYLEGMRSATKGLVDDMTLAREATQALSTGVVKSSADMATLAKDGATLGLALKGDAAQGIEILTRDLEMVGSKRGLKELGLDADVVMTKFDKLKGTMGQSDAWRMAVLDVASQNADKLSGALDSTGTALDRLKVKFDNFMAGHAENVAIGIEATINLASAVADHISNQMAANAKAYDNSAIGKQTPVQTYGGEAPNFAGDPTLNGGVIPKTTSGDRGFIGPANPNNPNMPDFMQTSQGAYSQGPYSPQPSIQQRVIAQDSAPDSATQSYIAQGKAYQAQQAEALAANASSGAYGGSAGYDPGSGGLSGAVNTSSQRYLDARFGKGKYKDNAQQQFTGEYSSDVQGFTTGQYQQSDAQQGLQALMPGVKDFFNNVTAEGNKLVGAFQSVTGAALAASKQFSVGFQSSAQAFGLTSGGIGGEYGQTIAGDIAFREAEQKKKIGTSAYWTPGAPAVNMKDFNKQEGVAYDEYKLQHENDKDWSKENKQYQEGRLGRKVAAETSGSGGQASGPVYKKADYDKQVALDNEAMDKYRIATGQATTESLAFDKVKSTLSESFRAGKITLAQEIDGYTALAIAAKNGKTSLDDLLGVEKELAKTDPEIAKKLAAEKLAQDKHFTTLNERGDFGPAPAERPAGGERDKADPAAADASKPWDGATKSATDYMAAQAKIPAATVTVQGQMMGPMASMAKLYDPLLAKQEAVQASIKLIGGLIRGLVGELSINVNFTGGAASDGGGRVPSHGAF